jgi:hypothetical protein
MARFMDVAMITFSLIRVSLADYGAPKGFVYDRFCDVAVSFPKAFGGRIN